MKTIPDSLTPEQAWGTLCACSRLPAEGKPLAEALDHCLAEDFLIPEDVPVAGRSFMDGYAVRSEDVLEVPSRLKLVGEVLMGEAVQQQIGQGETMAVPTGGFLPAGADAVVMQEDTTTDEDSVVVKKSVAPMENVQSRAEDFRQGDFLFSAGHLLRPQDLSAIATFGVAHVKVHRKPSLAIISTGNELFPFATRQAAFGKIRETNSLALASAARTFHFTARNLGIIPDDFQAQRLAMEEALRQADVILVSGGSSVGARDFTMEVIQSFPESKVHFHGLAVRPGNPTIFASIGSRSVFGLPGQPVSSLVVFYLFVLPFLFHLSGEQVHSETFALSKFRTCEAKLCQTIKPLKFKTDVVRLRLTPAGAVPVLGKSASLSTLASADGFTIVPPGDAPLEEGTILNVILFP